MNVQLTNIENELSEVEQSKANQIRQTFNPMTKVIEEFEGMYLSIIAESQKGITIGVIAKAKELRLAIAKVRIKTEKVRKLQKSEILIMGRAIDGVANILKWAINDKENALKEIEEYFENQEVARKTTLQLNRETLLAQYVENVDYYNLVDMHEDVFNSFLESMKKIYFAEKQAEEDAEIKRIKEEKERQDAIALKEEQKAKERAKLKAENDKLRAENIKREQEMVAERKAKQLESDKLKAELKAKEKIESDRVLAETKAKADAEAIIQAELSKGDSEKILSLIDDIENLKSKYSFKSKANKDMYKNVSLLMDKVISHIQK